MKNKFNIIDFLVIVFVCALVAFLGFKFSHKAIINEADSNAKTIIYTLKVEDIMDLTVNALPEHGEIYEKEGSFLGNVVGKEVTNAVKTKTKTDGHYVKATIPDKYDVVLTVEANAVIKNEGYFINGKKNIGSGSELIVKAPDVEFLSHVIEIKTK